MQAFERSYDHYNKIYSGFIKFEDTAVDFYSDGDREKRHLTHPAQKDMRTEVANTIIQMKNPMRDVYLWIKGEFLDVKGMIDAMNGRESTMKAQLACENKRRSDQTELEKLSLGKTTMKSFFQSKSGKDKTILNL